MVPVIAGPVYGSLYKATIHSFPGAFLIFTAAVYVVVIQILSAIYLVRYEVDQKIVQRGERALDKPIEGKEWAMKEAKEEKEEVEQVETPRALLVVTQGGDEIEKFF
jgi:TRAP-type mannitol/chloroaromatic compound transport system permease large subunit